MNPKHLHILQHALGVDEYGQGNQYRNRYVVGPESDGFTDCQKLVADDLMQDYGPQSIAGGMHLFIVTEEGKRVMKENSPTPPKLTRSQRRMLYYRECADCFEDFRQFLRFEKRQRELGKPLRY